MPKNGPKFVVSYLSEKRQVAKLRRGFGLKFINEKRGGNVVKWCQARDPLFKVKGKLRHQMLGHRFVWLKKENKNKK